MTQSTNDTGSVCLDPDDLIEHARLAAGDHDGRPLRFLATLDRLTRAADDAGRLTHVGRLVLRDNLIKHLTTQLHAARLLEEHPEIAELPVEPPIVITGLARTGTTALHNLLAQVPGLRAPLLWELMAPAWPDAPEQLIAAARAYVDLYYAHAPVFGALHPVGALAPDECHRMISGTFASEIYFQRYYVPDYARWLIEQDRTQEYRYHRMLLRCLLWRSPGGRPLLKCPTHLGHLSELAAAYPGAVVIRLHREMTSCIASACGLTATAQALSRDDVDQAEIGEAWLEFAGPMLGRLRAGEHAVPGIRILDLRQEDLLADPVGLAARICEFAGVPLPPDARERLRAHAGENASGGISGRRFTLEEFGLDAGRVEAHFAGYRTEFGL